MENQTLLLKGNQKCAIIGKTGAGKSTTATVLAEIQVPEVMASQSQKNIFSVGHSSAKAKTQDCGKSPVMNLKKLSMLPYFIGGTRVTISADNASQEIIDTPGFPDTQGSQGTIEMFDKVVECIKNEKPNFLIWLIGVKDMKRAGGDQINYYCYLIDKLSQDCSIPCYILANDQDADPTIPDPDNPFAPQVVDKSKKEQMTRDKRADVAGIVHGWLKAVDAITLTADESGLYYSFNKSRLLENFTRLIVAQFCRPLNKTAQPGQAKLFSQMVQYFSDQINAADAHQDKMAAAKKKLTEADSAREEAKKILAVRDLTRDKSTCWIPGVGLGFAIDHSIKFNTRNGKINEYSSALAVHDTLLNVDTTSMMDSFNKSQKCMGHIISGLALDEKYQKSNPQIAALMAVFAKLKGGIKAQERKPLSHLALKDKHLLEELFEYERSIRAIQ